MSTFTFDQTFEALVGLSGGLIVLASCWIVSILIFIEKTKASAFSSVIEEDGSDGDLHFEESTTGHIEMTDQPHGLEVERPEDSSSPKNGAKSPPTSPRSPTTRRHQRQTVQSPPNKTAGKRRRRVPWSFVWMQVASVVALILLTYLLLVVSNAPIWLRALGSIVVFFIFLRFQIGEELRRQRMDRIILLVSLFLLIASMMSLCVYSMKTLKQGEIYEGPARIVGYDLSNYNNTQHDPTTRTDIAVSWGKDWGCPMSGGKVCQSRIQGAMCQVHPEKEQTKHKPSQRRQLARMLTEDKDLEEDLEDEEKSNQELESENENLEKENEELQQEVDELKKENQIDEEEVKTEEEEATAEEYVVEDEYGEEIFDADEEVYEYAEKESDMEYEADVKEKQEEMDETTDPDEKEELQEEITEDEQDEEMLDEEYEEVEEDYSEYADEYDQYIDEDLSDYEDAEEDMENLEDEKAEVEEEVEQTESEVEQQKESTPSYGNGSSGSSSSQQSSNSGGDEGIAEEEEIAEEAEEAEVEEVVEEYEESEYGEDEWYWDEYPSSYDDDLYEDEYWSYDWDSVWGEYACEDLFDSEVGSRTYDPNTPAGGDDEWPFINIYGSCKTCEAYVLDYFAEEAFEELEDYEKQAVLYMGAAVAGFLASLVMYVKYRVMPTAENEVELLGGDGGVLA